MGLEPATFGATIRCNTFQSVLPCPAIGLLKGSRRFRRLRLSVVYLLVPARLQCGCSKLKQDVKVLDCPRGETSIQAVTVERLEVSWGKVLQFRLAQCRCDMHPNEPFIALEGYGFYTAPH